MARLTEIVVEVADVTAAARFYSGLGLTLRRSGTWEDGEYAELADDDGRVLMVVDGDAGPRLTLTVDDAAATLGAAVDAGAVVERDPAPGGGGTWATARDPFGVALGFWSR